MERLLPVLPVASWAAVVAAALLDPAHRVLRDYISWLSAGPWAPLAAAGVLGLVLATMLAARRLQAHLAPTRLRASVVTLLVCAAVLGVATLVLPSTGRNEAVERTALHVGLAVGAYQGIALPAVGLAWLARRGQASRHFVWWAAGIVAALAALLVLSAGMRLGAWQVDLRGVAQLVLAGAAAGWLAAVLRMRGVVAPRGAEGV